MTIKSKLTPLALAASMGAAAITAPVAANAGMSASVGVTNFYLWRGDSLSQPSPAVSGSLDYGHDSGFYAGIWTSSEGVAGSHEYDLYAGFGMEMGDLSVDINLTSYQYPEEAGSVKFGDWSELIIGLGFAGASVTIYNGLQGELTSGPLGGYTYLTLGYEMDKVGVTYGTWSYDSEAQTEYSHLDISYAATDEVAFTFSQIVDDDDDESLDTDLLVNVAWSKSWDL